MGQPFTVFLQGNLLFPICPARLQTSNPCFLSLHLPKISAIRSLALTVSLFMFAPLSVPLCIEGSFLRKLNLLSISNSPRMFILVAIGVFCNHRPMQQCRRILLALQVTGSLGDRDRDSLRNTARRSDRRCKLFRVAD